MNKKRAKSLTVKHLPSLWMLAAVPFVMLTALELAHGEPVPWWQLALTVVYVASSVSPGLYRLYLRYQIRRLNRRLNRVGAPQNVRVECRDGRVIRCGILRDSRADEDGRKAFLVIPLEAYRVRSGDQICWDKMPFDVVLHVPASQGRILRYERSRHN